MCDDQARIYADGVLIANSVLHNDVHRVSVPGKINSHVNQTNCSKLGNLDFIFNSLANKVENTETEIVLCACNMSKYK